MGAHVPPVPKRFRELDAWWDDEETGERYEIHARLLWPDDPGGPAVESAAPWVSIRKIFDFSGRDVTGEIFGTFASLEIRELVENLAAAVEH
jgi:hypothetical protein